MHSFLLGTQIRMELLEMLWLILSETANMLGCNILHCTWQCVSVLVVPNPRLHLVLPAYLFIYLFILNPAILMSMSL